MTSSSYLNPSLSTPERVEDLLGRMTLEEKIGQLCQVDGRMDSDLWLFDRHVGSFLHVTGEDQIALQKKATTTRLGIPILFGIDAIHGHAFQSGATVYPSQLALACSFDRNLLERVATNTAREVAATGMHWTFSPVLCIARDLRWGRVDETFGEDPYLIGELGAAMIRGYQGDKLSDPASILACAKHFVAYGETVGARDASEATVTPRALHDLFLPPFEKAVAAGVGTVMAGYHAIDGVPCSANRPLMVDLLKDTWGFDGFTITDWNNVGYMHTHQRVAPDIRSAAKSALQAGQDMIMSTPDFYEAALALVREGEVPVDTIDASVRRILKQKFDLGLFDDKRFPPEDSFSILGAPDHLALARESALKSFVLLKNEGVLPLDPEEKIALIGPTIDDVQALLGDWSFGTREHPERPTLDYHPEYDTSAIVTFKKGLVRRDPGALCHVGCDLFHPSAETIEEAVGVAGEADTIVAVVGDTNTLNGETRDRVDLRLTGDQEKLIDALAALGKPLVVVVLSGKPLILTRAAAHADALVQAFNPGMFGGEMLWPLLYGEENFSGRLPISFPKAVGQQPTYYNQLPGWHTDRYVEMDARPLFAFGEGLSYTTFALKSVTLSAEVLGATDAIEVTAVVENTGERNGIGTLQLYVHDLYASVTRPVKELKGFERCSLAPGESATIRFHLTAETLRVVGPDLRRHHEPGDVNLYVGFSSLDRDLITRRIQLI
jgi:beta-glucosidase